MKNTLKFFFFAIPLLYNTTHAMDQMDKNTIKEWERLNRSFQEEAIIQDRQTKIAATKYYMLTDQLVPPYLMAEISDIDKATFRSARTHNERLQKQKK